MQQTKKLSSAEIEGKVANVVAGHKMAGFDITDENREMVREIIIGELTADDVVARVKARNESP